MDPWILGDHRLLCGDSTSHDDVRRPMNGERAILFATDPPYLVDYDGWILDSDGWTFAVVRTERLGALT